jgi:hypothetical protein
MIEVINPFSFTHELWVVTNPELQATALTRTSLQDRYEMLLNRSWQDRTPIDYTVVMRGSSKRMTNIRRDAL